MNYVKEVKHILETQGYITSWEAIQRMGNTRLSATIHMLRHRYNMPIEMEIRKTKTGKRYGYYYLKKEEPFKLKEWKTVVFKKIFGK